MIPSIFHVLDEPEPGPGPGCPRPDAMIVPSKSRLPPGSWPSEALSSACRYAVCSCEGMAFAGKTVFVHVQRSLLL